jgi:FMN-dependent NADH-azoreductase
MSRILHINSSLFSNKGNSSRLADKFLASWVARYPETEITRRDLAATSIPHLDEETIRAFSIPADRRTPEQCEKVALSNSLVEELKSHDILVLGVPMYNFGVPSTLKAWIDQIMRAGVTFKYTEGGTVGLMTGKKAIVLAARGGVCEGTALDTQTPYLKNVLGFIGIDDVSFIYAEKLNMHDIDQQRSWRDAENRIVELVSA